MAKRPIKAVGNRIMQKKGSVPRQSAGPKAQAARISRNRKSARGPR